MADDDVRICIRCKTVSTEDSVMWEEPERCPKCGSFFDEEIEVQEEEFQE